MNIIESAKAMNECKKVRRLCFIPDAYIYRGIDGYLRNANDSDTHLDVDDLLSDDWEIYEKQKD